MIEINNVTKEFHTLVAINNLSLKIPVGEVVGILGPNGAGKTTLFKLIAGFLHPNSGSIKPSSGNWPNIGFKPDRLLFPNRMRIREYLEMVAALSNINGQSTKAVVEESLNQVKLLNSAEKRIQECSKGMRQRLGLAQAMIGDPPLLLLDEPSNGLDPEGQADICRQIGKLHTLGKTIILASHQLHEVTQVCTYLVILNEGSIHYQNRMADALAIRPHVIINVDEDLQPIKNLLHGLHPDIEVNGSEIILEDEAIFMRRQILSLVVSAGYDVTHVEHSRVTLAEIYIEAVR